MAIRPDAARTVLREWRWGAAASADLKNGALEDEMRGNGLAGVGQIARARRERRTGMRSRCAERARGAVQRRFEVTEKIVMLELSRGEEQAVQQDAQKDEPAEPRAFPEEHLTSIMTRWGQKPEIKNWQ